MAYATEDHMKRLATFLDDWTPKCLAIVPQTNESLFKIFNAISDSEYVDVIDDELEMLFKEIPKMDDLFPKKWVDYVLGCVGDYAPHFTEEALGLLRHYFITGGERVRVPVLERALDLLTTLSTPRKDEDDDPDEEEEEKVNTEDQKDNKKSGEEDVDYSSMEVISPLYMLFIEEIVSHIANAKSLAKEVVNMLADMYLIIADHQKKSTKLKKFLRQFTFRLKKAKIAYQKFK